MPALPPFYVEAPNVLPLRYGLLSVAEVRDTNDPHALGGIEFESQFCGPAAVAVDPCTSPQPAKTTTTFAGTKPGVSVVTYSLYQCRGPGDIARHQDRAMTALNSGEGRALEQGFYEQSLTTTASVDLTPATVPSPRLGLAMLEQWAGQVYGGTPIIHVRRLTGSLLTGFGIITAHGTHLETGLGSLVAVGAGYQNASPADVAAPANTSWMYATGAVLVNRGPAVVYPTAQLRPYANEFVTLAERPWTVAFDCFAAAVRVTNTE